MDMFLFNYVPRFCHNESGFSQISIFCGCIKSHGRVWKNESHGVILMVFVGRKPSAWKRQRYAFSSALPTSLFQPLLRPSIINVSSTHDQRNLKRIHSAWSTYHQRMINVTSTYQQRMINVSSTHDQPNVNVSSTYHQPSINVSTAHDQCIISVSSTSHHLARKRYMNVIAPPTPPNRNSSINVSST